MNTPKIRFKGYTDAWEQRKLGDFGEATGGTSIESEFSEDGIYKVINIGSYSEDSTYRDQGIRAIDSEKTKNRVLNAGDLTMILNDKTASGNIIGRALLIEESGVYVYNQRTERIEIYKDKYDAAYIYEMLNAPEIRDKIIKQSQGNTQIYVNWSAISQTEYLVPKFEEQCRIGEFLQKLGTLITLHQRKCDSLNAVKKYMLQKMFPKQGESVPEIRFKGFTGAWEQRKLGDQMYIKSRIGWQALTRDEYLEDGSYYLITGKDIDENTHTIDLSRCYYVSKERYDMDDKIQVKEGDIIVTKDGTIGKVAMVTGLDKPATLNSHLFVLRDLSGKLDNRFLLQVLNSHIFNAFVAGTKTGSTLTGLPQKTFVEFKFLVPDYKEQQKISWFLDTLDNLITLHQRKADSLKELKKFMLQNMFP